MSNYKLKVSRPGKDVKFVEDKDLVYSSDFKTFKIYKIVGSSSIQTVAHGLDYAPSFIALAQRSDGTWNKAYGGYYYFGEPYIAVDDTNIYFLKTNAMRIILFIDRLDE